MLEASSPHSSHSSHHRIPVVVKTLASGFVLASLLIGCASVDKKGGEEAAVVAPAAQAQADDSKAAADNADQMAENKAAETKTTVTSSAPAEKKQAESDADKMMASLAAKSKFDESSEPTTQTAAVKPKAKKLAPKQPPVKPMPTVKEVPSKAEPVVTKATEPAKDEVKKEVAAAQPAKAPESQAAPAPVVSSAEKFKPLDATRKDLPINYDIWKIRKGEATLDKELVITTPTWEMGERGFMSQIWITVMDDKLLINSSSDIYAPEGKTGIKLNGGELIPFDRIVEDNIGVLDGEQWLDKLAQGGNIEVFMGFFPDRVPKSGIYKSSLGLDTLGRVAATYKKLK